MVAEDSPAPRHWRTAYWASLCALWGFIALAVLIAYYALTLPDTDNLWQAEGQQIAVYGADDSLLAQRGHGGGQIEYDLLPRPLLAAVVAIEDRRFFTHYGLDFRGLARAAWVNFRAGALLQGGSTLTQQLAKNLFLSPKRNLKRKIQELLLALWLEARLSKEEILALYLNRVYFGSGAYGVQAAAHIYFDTVVTDLTLAESAILAGILKAPSRYAPNRNFGGAVARANLVLDAMVESNFIAPTARMQIDPSQVEIAHDTAQDAGYAVDWTLDLLPDFIGTAPRELAITTTIDPILQRAAQSIIARAVAQYGAALNFDQAALVAMTPSGAVRALVGGVDHRRTPFNRAIYTRRQPGSAFKPFVYLAGLQAGIKPNDEFIDAPIDIGGWSPKNYNDAYQGRVDVTTAFAQSINTVAVQISEEAGRGEIISLARRLGLTAPIAPNPSIALGAINVSPLELVSAYTSLANGGLQVFPHIILSVEDADGQLLYRRSPSSAHRILARDTLRQLNGLMRAAVENGTGRAAQLADTQVYGKTGTSQNWRDAWFVGYTDALVVGVWVGNDDNSPMAEVVGGGVPTRIWRDFMAAAKGNLGAAADTEIFAPRQRGIFDWLFGN